MEQGLHKLANQVVDNMYLDCGPMAQSPLDSIRKSNIILTAYANKLYNVLFFIQQDYWSSSLPALKSDLSKYQSQLFK